MTDTQNLYWHPDRSRHIVRRIVVTGDLILQTPASFSTGDQDDLVDIPLLTDAAEPNRPLLTGASLAGALRAYLAAHEPGMKGNRHAERLFGGQQGDSDGEQSQLIVADSLGEAAQVELRHGVRIDGQSRTAAEGALYDRTLWAAGTRFPLRFELVIAKPKEGDLEEHEAALKAALATALLGLEQERIGLGGRKTRGCGRAKVASWTVATYEMSRPEDLRAWVLELPPADNQTGEQIVKLLATPIPHRGGYFELRAAFKLDGALLIRTEGSGNDQPDFVHQCARQPDGKTTAAILAGTSLTGALRARASRIARTLDLETDTLIESIFGAHGETRKSQGSRLTVSEQTIAGGEQDLVQPRVSIDRFTGGARETALFSEQPVFSSNGEAGIQITLRLKQPELEQTEPEQQILLMKQQIGLLLLTLKDLWTHDLPVGGEGSVGRGRWLGQWAELTYQPPPPEDTDSPQTWAGGFPPSGGRGAKHWTLRSAGEGRNARLVLPPDAADLEEFVRALHAAPRARPGATAQEGARP